MIRNPIIWLLATFGIACILLSTNLASAQNACLPLESVIEAVSQFHEVPAWEGTVPTAPSGATVLLFQSPSGTWTLVAVHGVMACILAVGTGGAEVISGQET